MIAIFTESGFTARYLAAERLPIPTVAFSPNTETAHRLSLAFGILPRLVRNVPTSQQQTIEGERILIEEGLAEKGDRIVMIFGSARASGFTNIVNFRILGESLDQKDAPASSQAVSE